MEEKDVDLRDPKFSVTPDDRMMIVCGGSIYLGTKQIKGRQPRVMFSRDGREFTPPQKVLENGDWLWRVTWHDGVAYGTTYKNVDAENKPLTEWSLRLVSSTDGVSWKPVSTLEVSGHPNETTLRFLKDGRMIAMVRRESGVTKAGWLGESAPPYTRWTWHESNYQFGGPNFIELPGGRFVAGTRDYSTKGKATMLLALMSADATMTPMATLPSGGDCSYPGLVYQEGVLWVSYYSSHEGKTSIYLAKVKLYW
jgi:hypothetical protein